MIDSLPENVLPESLPVPKPRKMTFHRMHNEGESDVEVISMESETDEIPLPLPTHSNQLHFPDSHVSPVSLDLIVEDKEPKPQPQPEDRTTLPSNL